MDSRILELPEAGQLVPVAGQVVVEVEFDQVGLACAEAGWGCALFLVLTEMRFWLKI